MTVDSVSDDAISRFRESVLSGNAAQLQKTLEEFPELRGKINDPIFSFDCPAIVPAASRSRETVDMLLAHGADINARSTWWAGSFGVLDNSTPEMAEFLISRGAVVDINAAAHLGMLDRVKELVAADPQAVHHRGGDGQTPLHVASTVEIAAFLLDHGAEIDARDVDHESTAAQYLVKGRPEVTRYLISRGCQTDILMAAAVGDLDLVRRKLDADPASLRTRVNGKYFPKQNPRSGGTIYIWQLGGNFNAHQVAARFGQKEVLQYLMEHSPADLQLTVACSLGDEAKAKALVAEHPGLADQLSAEDQEQVVSAAEGNRTEAVRLMLECGWPVAGVGGPTPLHFAAWHGNVEMMRAILPFHPPLEQPDPSYHATPLGWAMHGSENSWHRATGDYAGVVRELLRAGAKRPAEIAGSAAVQSALREA